MKRSIYATGVLVLILASLRIGVAAQEPCTITVAPGQSIQAAIYRVPNGGIVCLTEGKWYENINVTKSLTLRGQGPEKSVIYPAIGPLPRIISLTPAPLRPVLTVRSFRPADQVRIEGLAVQGIGGEQNCGILIEGNVQATIENCRVLGISPVFSHVLAPSPPHDTPGIVVRGEARALVSNCTVDKNTGTGIGILDSAFARITRCSITENSDVGIALKGLSHAVVENCKISGNGISLGFAVGGFKAGLITEDSARLVINDCSVTANEVGVTAFGSTQVWIDRSEIRGNRDCGVQGLSTSPVRGSLNSVSGNGVDLLGNVVGSLRLGLLPATEALIIYPDPRYPTLQHAVDALVPGGRLVLGEGQYEGGITVSKPVEITGTAETNTIVRSGVILFLVTGADANITGLTLDGYYGVMMGGTSRATIRDCTITNKKSTTSLVGIALQNEARLDVVNCHISRARQVGIEAKGASWIAITGSSIFSYQIGFTFQGSSKAQIRRCEITAFRCGVIVGGSSNVQISDSHFSPLFNGKVIDYKEFTGYVSGRCNTSTKELGCPPELMFLFTEEGGELDRRK